MPQPVSDRDLPLAGFTIIDLTQLYQGPYATMMMAMAGADVIKVEPPGGEILRQKADAGKQTTVAFAMLNSNKRAVTLNLKSRQGSELFKQMVAKADALVENYAPGVMDRLGLGYEVLSAINPRLVYASATGFGLSGPDRDNLAMDYTIQAASGIMSLTGLPDSGPLRTGAPYSDILGGAHLYAGMVTALLQALRTGRGRLVEIAMIETNFASLATAIEQYHRNGKVVPERTGNRFANNARSPYNVYATKDGHIAMIAVTEMHWQNLLSAMQREDLKDDPRFVTNEARCAHIDETEKLVGDWCRSLSKAEVFALTSRYRIPCAPVRDVEEVMNDPHMHSRGTLQTVDHYDLGPLVLQHSPLHFHGAEQVALRVNPKIGEHNDDIYGGWLDVPPAARDELRKAGVI